MGEGRGEGPITTNYRGGRAGAPDVDLSRKLRRSSTDAERALWSRLRGGTIGVKFRRQHQFGPYILDFYCTAAKVVVELDGAQHLTPAGLLADADRSGYLASRGLRAAGHGEEGEQGQDGSHASR